MLKDLTQWLGEQLDEDKRIAFDAGGDRWSHHGGSLMWPTERGPRDAVVTHQGSAVGCIAITNPVHGDGTPEALHIVEHDPARVLREIDAKRQVVAQHTPSRPEYMPHRERGCLTCTTTQAWDDKANEANCLTLRLLALPYADRPGYRPEWRP